MEALLLTIIDFLRTVGPEVVFLMTFVETAFFIGLLIPAEATVLVAAFLAAEGVFSLEQVLAATLLGAFAGDQIGYLMGRVGGRRYAARGGRLGRLWARYEPRATSMFRRRAAVSITLARFVSFVRTLMPWFAGMTGVPYRRFLLWDILGVLGWGVASVAAGYLAGSSWHVIADALGTASAIIIGAVVLAGVVAGYRARHVASQPESPATEGDHDAASMAGPPEAEPVAEPIVMPIAEPMATRFETPNDRSTLDPPALER